MSRGHRIFRRLLRLFPAEFRGDFGEDMTRTFEEHRRDVAARGGLLAHLRLWTDTIAGILTTAPREHWDLLRQDVRYGLRSLRRSPTFAAVAILALGLGVGATTAMFSVVNAVLLQPLPYRGGDRLVRLIEHVPARESVTARPERTASIATDEFADWRSRMRTLSHMGMYAGASMTLTERGTAIRLHGARVSPDIFPMLGLQPVMGRVFERREEARGADAVALIAHRVWQRDLGGDPLVLGRSVTLDGRAHAIVGVMGADAVFPERDADFWVPFVPLDPRAGLVMRAPMIARLADGATIEAAGQEALAIGQPLRPRPRTTDAAAPPRFEVLRVHDEIVAPVRPALRMLMGAVLVVLLIACANVANLLLARHTTRQREMAIRAALGAGRARLVRQVVTESFVLALLGGVVGLALAYGGVSLVRTLATVAGPFWLATGDGNVLPRVDNLVIDRDVLLFSLAATYVTGLLFGIGPVVHLTRARHMEVIKEAAAGALSGLSLFSRQRGRRVLVIAQLAMAMVLLVGAGLLIRSFVTLARVDTGFEARHVVTFQAVLPPGRLGDPGRPAFAHELTRRLRDLPQVQSAGFSNMLPLSTGMFMVSFTIPGITPDAMAAGQRPQTRYVSQDYLRALGVRLVEGRWFSDEDGATGAKVVLINQALARRFFRDRSPVRTFVTLGGAPWEIIGVVGDVRQGSLQAEAQPQWFIDFRQLPEQAPFVRVGGGVFFAVRTSGDPLDVVGSIRALAQQIESAATLDQVYALDDLVASALARPRFYAILLGAFACAAGALAAIGIYGVLAYSVAQRTREIGIRMALGAPRRRVLWLVLGQGAALALTGILLGVAGAVAVTHSLRAMLFGVTPLDPLTFLGVSIAFAGIAALACYVPARRATAVDPLTVLREE